MEKKTKQDINFDLCIICQKEKEGKTLVENPSCHEKLVTAVQERSTYGDSKYSEIWSAIRIFSKQELCQASRHRTCYQDATHSSKLKRAKAKYERDLAGTDIPKRKLARMNEQQSGSQLTRSKTTPYNKDLCFFSAKEQQATVILYTLYHKNCWSKNVSNVLRKPFPETSSTSTTMAAETAAKIEFLNTTDSSLRNGNILNMSDLHALYASADKAQVVNATREKPQQLAVGLAIHQSSRSKELVNLLHGFGMSVEYNRLLRVEAQIESAVLDRMEKNDGIFLPPEIVIGRHVFFAVDNVDFAEDTYDGKNTLHGTAIAIYQKCHLNDENQI
ncbi:hypothetical protein AC249_AIPGENE22744 [Exaiptasia diaphana]|nr:hypothetical protein AC249_AIPGENE22744 [Exaiptasia diaphana]